MKSLFFDGRDLFIREMDIPIPEQGEVLIRVLMAGICKTDLEIVKGYMDFKGILGHEFVGEVVEAENKSLIGKRVVGEINCPCYRCSFCLQGMSNHCPTRTVLGINNREGVFAEYTTLPERNLHIVPDSVSDEVAVFTEPVAAGFRILEQIQFNPEDFVVVLGDGRMGQIISQIINPYVRRLVCVGKHTKKLFLLNIIGIDTCLLDYWKDKNLDVVIDATGNPTAQSLALDRLRPQGTLVIKSTTEEQNTLNLSKLVVDEIKIIGSRCGPFGPALKALSEKKVEVEYMISYKFAFEDIIKAFEIAQSKDCLKVLIDFRNKKG
ncbi:MAG TPA: alcohol dehydrogenase catalytic domain-containing protein [Candidatus Hydrogenedens sp.]|nr:alcohol dehydrogenase catalytic domain-containing protein [Candidatus Hydrogenedens sp.]HOL21080.1 alcohol dehydrogenase catalytic domain-containing protein [Candidatus Hydrogenedens sp.]HPP59538.1 alcohol dehydrogenase catalytic domain-containing protein [Candidatus Hydrogenedens sp.]